MIFQIIENKNASVIQPNNNYVYNYFSQDLFNQKSVKFEA